jgi:hypothetical protein
MKTEVYSWRVSAEHKAELESEARREEISLATLLDQITADWLSERRNLRNGDEAEQADLRRRAIAAAGKFRNSDPTRSERTGQLVREIIDKKHQKQSHASRRPH